ncbi:MAG: PEP-CTERM sorting domain-containing protein [Planctomycetota bacterium]
MAVLLVTSFVSASIIEVGTGANTVGVEIEWSDGFLQEFTVSFDTPSISGWDAISLVEANTSMVLTANNWGTPEEPSWFIDGIDFDGHSNIGYLGGEDFWHYWTMDVGEIWASSLVGASERIMLPGDTDGWVYGHAFAPGVPEPATMALFALGGLLIRKRS